MKKDRNMLFEQVDIYGAKTTPYELIRETIINFAWGFVGNGVTVFISREIDAAVLISFVIYYILISYIVNRAKYETRLGKFIVLPGSAAIGAFTGYKVAQIISSLI